MRLSDLPPDIAFTPLDPSSRADFDFSYAVKKAALGPHVATKWGWDDVHQTEVHACYCAGRPFLRIVHNGESAGTISLLRNDKSIEFNEFYLLPAFQNKGLGSRILLHVFDTIAPSGLPIRLKYLKWNPVGRLYARHGFQITGETGTHWLMERP